jgi:DNA-binding NarL/FixJ family response regulator
MNGLSVLQKLRQSANATKVILLTASENRLEYAQAMQLGCSGIVLKQTGLGLIVQSIRKVIDGEIWLDAYWWPESGTVH